MALDRFYGSNSSRRKKMNSSRRRKMNCSAPNTTRDRRLGLYEQIGHPTDDRGRMKRLQDVYGLTSREARLWMTVEDNLDNDYGTRAWIDLEDSLIDRGASLYDMADLGAASGIYPATFDNIDVFRRRGYGKSPEEVNAWREEHGYYTGDPDDDDAYAEWLRENRGIDLPPMNSSKRRKMNCSADVDYLNPLPQYYDAMSVEEAADEFGIDLEDMYADSEALERANYGSIVGYLRAKPEYAEVLGNDGYDYLTLISDNGDIIAGQDSGGQGRPVSFYDVSEETIKDCLEAYGYEEEDFDSARRVNASRRRKMNCSATIYTEALSPKEMDMIKDIFRKNDISIESTSNSTGEDDGVVFREYLVRTGDTNSLHLGYLQDDLRMLEESHDIGYWDEENENGFYAKDYHFFHYPDK